MIASTTVVGTSFMIVCPSIVRTSSGKVDMIASLQETLLKRYSFALKEQ
jgi:hypothetical protein